MPDEETADEVQPRVQDGISVYDVDKWRYPKAMKAIRLNRATIRTIHQNLFLVFAYNVILIAFAASILYRIF